MPSAKQGNAATGMDTRLMCELLGQAAVNDDGKLQLLGETAADPGVAALLRFLVDQRWLREDGPGAWIVTPAGRFWFQSLDYVNLPATMNDSQARLDPDGVLRVVISHQDPGIQNWIALGGCPQGAITYRWNNADSAPVPMLRLMPISEIDDRLHPETPRLSSVERAALDAERRRHALRRFTR